MRQVARLLGRDLLRHAQIGRDLLRHARRQQVAASPDTWRCAGRVSGARNRPSGPRGHASAPGAGPVAAALRATLDLDEAQVARLIRRHPPLACCPPEELLEAVGFLRGEAGLPKGALASAAGISPLLLTAGVGDFLRPNLEALLELLPEAVARSAVRDCPDVLLRPGASVREVVDLLRALGVDCEKAVRRGPRVLLREAADLRAIFDFLLDRESGPGLSAEQAATAASAYPMLMIGTKSVERQLAPLVRFLREDLGADPSSEACFGFYAWPDALATIGPAAEYLRGACGFPPEELREHVALLGHSLEARIRPRWLFAQKRARPRLSLRSLTSVDDTQFCHIVGATPEEFREFAMELRRDARRRR